MNVSTCDCVQSQPSLLPVLIPVIVGCGMNFQLDPGAGIRALWGVLVGTVGTGLCVAISMCTTRPDCTAWQGNSTSGRTRRSGRA